MLGMGGPNGRPKWFNDAKIYVKLSLSSQEKLIIAGRATDL